jgi:hypothetical protein
MNQLGIDLIHNSRVRDNEGAESKAGEVCEGEDARKGAGGAGRARNLAICQSSGDFLCFLDADDVMFPDRISRQLEVARR